MINDISLCLIYKIFKQRSSELYSSPHVFWSDFFKITVKYQSTFCNMVVIWNVSSSCPWSVTYLKGKKREKTLEVWNHVSLKVVRLELNLPCTLRQLFLMQKTKIKPLLQVLKKKTNYNMKIAYNTPEAQIPEYTRISIIIWIARETSKGIISNGNICVYSYKWLSWLKFIVLSNTEPYTLIDTCLTSMHPKIC